MFFPFWRFIPYKIFGVHGGTADRKDYLVYFSSYLLPFFASLSCFAIYPFKPRFHPKPKQKKQKGQHV
jgi:hypothetical protein